MLFRSNMIFQADLGRPPPPNSRIWFHTQLGITIPDERLPLFNHKQEQTLYKNTPVIKNNAPQKNFLHYLYVFVKTHIH